MGGFSDFLNETLSPEEGKKSAFLGFLDAFTKDEPTPKVEQEPTKTDFTSFLEETLPPDSGATNEAVRKNLGTVPPPQTEEYVDSTQAPPKEKPPWYDDYLGLIRPLLAGAQAGTAGITKALLKAADFISDKLGIPKSDAARKVADDLEAFSQANKARGVGGIVGDVASGIGQAAVDIPSIMALGPAGLPVYGGLMGAAEGGLPGALTGAVSGALTHGTLKGIGGLATPARVGAGAAFGAATTPGGLEERVKGATVMGVLSATGGRPQREVVDLRGKVPGTASARPVAGQTAFPPPPIEAPTARIVPEATIPRIKPSSISTAYLNEQINYGGELRARGSVIAEMQSQGVPQQRIGAYMMGAKTVRATAGLPSPATEAVGRVTKTTVPPAEAPIGPELPHGPTITGEVPSPVNPVIKTLGPQGASLTLDTVRALEAQTGKLRGPFTPRSHMLEDFPVFKDLIMDPLHKAQHNVALGIDKVAKDTQRWVKSIQSPRGDRVLAYAYAQQEGGAEYLKALGVKEVPVLTPPEMGVYNEIRQNMDTWFQQINAARAYLGHDPIGKIENYFTLLRKLPELEKAGHDLVLDPDARVIDNQLKKAPEPGVLKHRGTSELPLEGNLFDIYRYYARRVIPYIENAVPTAHGKLLLENIQYQDAQGKPQEFNLSRDARENFTSWLNFSTGHRAASAERVLTEKMRKYTGAFNRNMGSSILGFNLRSAAIQPTSLWQTYIEFGRKWMIKGAERYALSGGRGEAGKLSYHLFGRQFDVHVAATQGAPDSMRGKVGKAWGQAVKAGTWGLRALDYEAANLTWNVAYAKATAPRTEGGLGLSGEKAKVFADDATIRTQGSAARSDISPSQWTPEGKLLTMFQTFTINQWTFLLKHTFGVGNPGLSNMEKMQRVFRMALGGILINVFMEDILKMRSPIATPERAIAEGIKQGKNVGAIAYDTARELAETVPIVGGALRWSTERKTMLPAPLQAYADTIQGLVKAGRALTEGDLGIMKPEDVFSPLRLLGVPGTGQTEKMMRRRQQGGTWPQSILGQKMETLGTAAAGLSKADKELLKKYGVGPGAGKAAPKKNQKAIDDLLKKYGVKK